MQCETLFPGIIFQLCLQLQYRIRFVWFVWYILFAWFNYVYMCVCASVCIYICVCANVSIPGWLVFYHLFSHPSAPSCPPLTVAGSQQIEYQSSDAGDSLDLQGMLPRHTHTRRETRTKDTIIPKYRGVQIPFGYQIQNPFRFIYQPMEVAFLGPKLLRK